MNATEFFRGVIAELTKMGYNVRQQEGCWSRSNGSSWANGMPVGHVNHHFVIPLSSPLANGIQNVTYGDSALQGPKCNFYGGVDPRTGEKVITFISVGPSNNAGWGNLSVLNRVKAQQQPLGWAALHGLPDDYRTANVNYAGVELHHPGDATPWPDKLIELTVDLNVAMCKVAGWNQNRCIMHAEHSSRKVDMSWHGPKGGFDLRDLIAAKLSGITPPTTGDDELSAAEVEKIVDEINALKGTLEKVQRDVVEIRDRVHTPGTAWDNIQDIQAKLAAIAADDAVDDETTAKLLALAQDTHYRIIPDGAAWDNLQSIQAQLETLIKQTAPKA